MEQQQLQQLQKHWESQQQPNPSIGLDIGSFLLPAAPTTAFSAAAPGQGAPAAASSGGAPPPVSSTLQAALSEAGPSAQPGSSAGPSRANAAPQCSSILFALVGETGTLGHRAYTMLSGKDVAAPARCTLAAPLTAAGVERQRAHAIQSAGSAAPPVSSTPIPPINALPLAPAPQPLPAEYCSLPGAQDEVLAFINRLGRILHIPLKNVESAHSAAALLPKMMPRSMSRTRAAVAAAIAFSPLNPFARAEEVAAASDIGYETLRIWLQRLVHPGSVTWPQLAGAVGAHFPSHPSSPRTAAPPL